jgi:hypothetical protein
VRRPEKNVTKKILIWLLATVLLATVSLAHAQQQTKLSKIGWLAVRPASAAFAIESFQREFSKLGYVDGKNIVFEYRTPKVISTDCQPWPMSWSVLKLT